jgi:4-hydroxy-tetrahydrodipicolinate synthase
MFSGCIPTLVTPFHQQRIDTQLLHELIEWQITHECPALCIGGTTGEVYSLNIDEQETLFNMVAQSIRHRIPFIAHIIGQSTRKAIWLTQAAEAAGASAVIHRLTAYHANPIQQLLQHCHFIQQNTALPIYVECDVETLTDSDILQLADIPQVQGIVDTGHHIMMIDRVLQEVGPQFSISCGNDINMMSHMINGTQTYFSSLANIFPRDIPDIIKTAKAGHFDKAKEKYQALMPLYQTLMEASLPASLKYLLATMQLCRDEVQLPLTGINERQSKVIQKVYKTAKAICQGVEAERE